MKKKSRIWIYPLVIMGVFLILTNSCKKEEKTQVSVLPVLTTFAVTNITSTTATCGGTITSDGGALITARGVCWSTSANPTIALSTKTTDGTGTGAFTSSLTGLTASTTYYVRAYATNSVGTAYGTQVSFATSAVAPTLTTTAASSITSTTATSGGNITSDGGASVTARGVCWSTSLNPTITDSKSADGTGTGAFTSSIAGLTSITTYYVRAYATNSIGTSYGIQVSFTTLGPPTVTTTTITGITQTTATSGGNVTSDGGATVTDRGICWSTSVNPTIALSTKTTDGTGTGAFISSISGLTASTTYYVRAYATNIVGTVYGNTISFTTQIGIIFNPNLTYGSVTDIDGNVYKTITIGSQTWMAENLKTIKYSDGTAIPLVTAGAAWAALSTPGYCWYNNDAATYKATYGALYNEYTVNTDKLCPTGWHVPTDAEWETLTSYLGGESVAGGKLKETGTGHWDSPNTGATNETGFTALPGGSRYANGTFYPIGSDGSWFSPEIGSSYALSRRISNYYSSINTINSYKQNGISVRCLQGELQALPTVTTTAASSITQTNATSGGNVISDGGATITARGVCWSTSANPTIALSTKTTDGTGTGAFTSNLTGLTASTTYYVRAYATNSVATAYGTQVSFTTSAVGQVVPTLTTTTASSITSTTATSGGTITSDGGASVTSRGVCWSTSANPTIALSTKTTDGTGTGSFTSSLTGLTANTTYYVRAYATNSVGTAYGNQVSFTTTSNITTPTVTTTAVTTYTTTSATVGGNVTTSGGATVTERGVYWGTYQNPESTGTKLQIGSGTGSYSTSLLGLNPNTTYYVKAYAINSQGTAYGTLVSFTTSSGGQTGTVTDVEGNIYNTITIGTQTWMAENLKTIKYYDGTAIPLVTDGASWGALSTPGYCWYNNDAATYKATYGALYNWYTVNTGKLCPTGWHVSSDAEWTTLATYLGGESIAGGKLKETGTIHWASPNTGATNETGFTALPGGGRLGDGTFNTIRDNGYWWSSTLHYAGFPLYWYMSYYFSNVYSSNINMQYGLSVRCLRSY